MEESDKAVWLEKRILVCGDRNWTDWETIFNDLDEYNMLWEVVIIEGGAKGADSIARDWAMSRQRPLLIFPAHWDRYGRAAGPMRNKQMLEKGKPDIVLAYHNDLEHSKGTRNMVDQASKAGLEVIVQKSPDILRKLK